MNKITGFIKKNKKMTIGIAVVLIILFLLICIRIFIFPSAGDDVYGNRLKDIDNYKISKTDINEIKDELSDQTAVSKVSYSNEGRIITFIADLDTEIKTEDAKKYADIVSDKLSKKIKKYYDIQIIFNYKKNSKIYPIAGYKNKSSEDFVWSGNSE